MGFPRQEYWSGSPFPSPGDLPYPGIELRSLTLQADSLPSELPGKLTLVICFIHGISRVWIFEWEGHNSAHKTQKGGVGAVHWHCTVERLETFGSDLPLGYNQTPPFFSVAVEQMNHECETLMLWQTQGLSLDLWGLLTISWARALLVHHTWKSKKLVFIFRDTGVHWLHHLHSFHQSLIYFTTFHLGKLTLKSQSSDQLSHLNPIYETNNIGFFHPFT